MSMETKKEKDSAMNVVAKQTHLFSRQPPTVLGRIAFWAFLVGGLGGLAGAIALTILSGSPSRDIVITTVVGLASAAILATGFRWAPLVTILLGRITSTWSSRSPMSSKAWSIQRRTHREGLVTL